MIRVALAAVALLALQTGPVERGRSLSDWNSDASLARLNAAASPDLKTLIEDSGGAAAIGEQLGAEIEVVDEFAYTLNGFTTYNRLSRFENAPWMITTLAWDGRNVVNQASVRETIPPAPEGPDTWPDILFSLPFGAPDGAAWLVSWGGANFARNYHTRDRAQRYAYDFKLVREGWSFQGQRTRNASYYCWGQPIYAPAPGRVSEAVDGVADNEPVGEMNTAAPLGNHVVIEHGPGVFGFYAHLQRGSVEVETGQALDQGALLGLCGNSGNSSEPHLHFHVQTNAEFSAGEGVPTPFSNYLLGDERVVRGAPLRGELVRP